MSDLLDQTIRLIEPANADALAAAQERQNQLTKPPGSLGVLEHLGIQLAGIAAQCPPPVPQAAVAGVFAADHGVCAQGVTPWPQEVTVQMLANMAHGGAAINVLCSQAGITPMLTDVGVAGDYAPHPNIRDRKVRWGTADLSTEAAMTREQAIAAIEVGIEAANEAVRSGAQCLLTGDMGIGNTTPSAALISVFTGVGPDVVTGRGAGADDAMLARKTESITRALALHTPDPDDPVGVLASVGGLEQGAIAGFILGAAVHRVPVVLDGVIACSAACVAVALNEHVRDYLISGHAGAEPGITSAVSHLGLSPLVDLGLRLGEGSGAALAYPLVQASARILNEMATFADVGISPGN